MLTLDITARDSKESPDDIRKKGLVPAIFYGRAEPATPIAVDALKFDRIFREAGETTIVDRKSTV